MGGWRCSVSCRESCDCKTREQILFLSSLEPDAAEALLRRLVPHHIVPWSANEKRRKKVKGQVWITLIVLSFMILPELSFEHKGVIQAFRF